MKEQPHSHRLNLRDAQREDDCESYFDRLQQGEHPRRALHPKDEEEDRKAAPKKGGGSPLKNKRWKRRHVSNH